MLTGTVVFVSLCALLILLFAWAAPAIIWSGYWVGVIAAAYCYLSLTDTQFLVTSLGFTIVWICMAVPQVRRAWLTPWLYKRFQTILPSMSQTEQEAIESGTVWLESDLFQGKPQWQAWQTLPKPQLSTEEQAFLDNEVESFCQILDDWQITHEILDLPEQAWAHIKRNKFFALIIPKQYGGLEFSALANSTIVQKIATRSLSAAVTVMVPNSLGPAELLMHYGTDEQKSHYLPKLAIAEEIPCFALTATESGSDATSMIDVGIVCEQEYAGKKQLGLSLTWSKRYITLAPVATVLGLAVIVKDPDGLLGEKSELGITVCLIPTKHPGVQIGHRHFPMNQAFMNGPTAGTDVFVPMDFIIGGQKMIGHGWRMLVECLSAGRGISLPALSTATAKHCFRTTGAYAKVRKQFNLPIGHFEGIEELLAKIGGYTYMLEATRLLTAFGVDQGEKPSVVSAIVKYHMTEQGRECIQHAMDIHGGKAILMGPNNYLARAYQGIPISITVEGANILTRCLIIFGQGAVRCHPYIQKEVLALQAIDTKQGCKAFDQLLFAHISYTCSNFTKLLLHTLTFKIFYNCPNSKLPKRYYRQLGHMSLCLACVADLALLLLGGNLKRKERLSARLGDVLSQLYISVAVIKYYENFGSEDDLPFVNWGLQTCLAKMQQAWSSFLRNFPFPVLSKLLSLFISPWCKSYQPPSDALEHTISRAMLKPSAFRDRITQGCYQDTKPNDALVNLEKAFEYACALNEPINELARWSKQGKLPKIAPLQTKIDVAFEKGLIDITMKQKLTEFNQARMQAIAVDEFADLKAVGQGG